MSDQVNTTVSDDEIDRAWQYACELDDRTSPEEYPDMALLTREELREAITLARQNTSPPRPLDEWHEDYGDVVWWCWRNGAWLGEASYIGTPLDLGQSVEIELRSNTGEFIHQHQVGGWPGYHTHWTPHPAFPAALSQQAPE